ncbi:hypothetical protein MHYP_G00102700 [Metynnis hypsauchen]
MTVNSTELHVEAPEEVTEGETADLTCNTTCSLPDPTFIWYKDGRPLTTKTIENNQLHLQTVSSEDAGSYSCAVRGSQHLHSTAHSIRVRYPPKNVSVSISPSEIEAGSSVTLTCSSDGYPPVKIYTWFKGSSPVGEGKTYSIPNIRSEDSREYTCQSRNDLGDRRSTAVYLNVLYPPKNVSVSISSSGHILNTGLRVKPPDDDSCSVNVYENVTKAGLRAPPPDDDSSSAQDYENLTNSGLNAPPPDDDSSSTDDYENITDDYENVTVLIYTINIQFLRAEKQRPPPVSSHTADKEASDGQTSQTLKGAVKTLITPLNV